MLIFVYLEVVNKERFKSNDLFIEIMTNLNDLITMQTDWTFKPHSIGVELKLGEEKFPQLDESTLTDHRRAFGYIYDEVTSARPQPTKVRITSELENGVQRVLIEHNGRPIGDDVLNALNSDLESYARGKPRYPNRKHGNHFAAEYLLKYGGRITLSNINDEEYHVQTKVEISISPNHTPPNP